MWWYRQVYCEELCKALNQAWGQDICLNPVVTDDHFTMDLRIVNKQKPHTGIIRLDIPTLFKDSELPVATSSDGFITLDIGIDMNIKVMVDWSTGGIQVKILENSEIIIKFNMDVKENLKLMIGTIPGALAGGSIHLGDPVVITMTTKSGGSINFSIQGKANLDANMEVFGRSLCRIKVRVDSLSDFLHGNEGAWTVDQKECEGGSLSKMLKKALDGHSLLDVFRHPGYFINKWKEGAKDLLKELFGRGENSLLSMYALPFVNDLIQKKLQEEIGKIAGSEVTNDLASGINAFVNQLVLNGTITNSTDWIEQVVLDSFTRVLCQVLKPDQCPKTPHHRDMNMKWELAFTRKTVAPIADVKFHVGDNKFADLKSDTMLQFEMTLKVKMILIYDRIHGFSIQFPDDRIVHCEATVAIEKGSRLEGTFGLTGGSISIPNSDSGVKAIIEVHHSLSAGWTATFHAKGDIKSVARIGFAGILDVPGKKSLASLPRIQTDLRVEFDFNQHDPNTHSPILHFENPRVCMGTVLANMARALFGEASHFLETVAPILGPTSILRREIPGLNVVFNTDRFTVADAALFVALYFDEGGDANRMQNVVESLDHFMFLLEFYEFVLRTAVLITDEEGCSAVIEFASFKRNVNDGSTHKTSSPTHFHVQYSSSISQEQRNYIDRVHSVTKEEKDYGITFPFMKNMDDLPETIFKLILGIDEVVIARISFPPMILASKFWEIRPGIMVYAAPPVFLRFAVSAYVFVKFPTLVLTAGEFVHMITTGKPVDFMRALKVEIRDSSGNYIPIAGGVFNMYGLLAMDLDLIEAASYIFLQFQVTASFYTSSGRRYMTFDELFHMKLFHQVDTMHASLKLKIQLFAGYGAFVKLCIPTWFGNRLCWVVKDMNVKLELPFIEDSNPKPVPQVYDDQKGLNKDVVKSDGKVFLSGDTVSYVSNQEGQDIPSRTSVLPDHAPFVANEANGYEGVTFVVQDPSGPITVPNSVVLIHSSENSRVISMNTAEVTPDKANKVSFPSGCNKLTITNGKIYQINGVPCPTTIQGDHHLSTTNIEGPVASVTTDTPTVNVNLRMDDEFTVSNNEIIHKGAIIHFSHPSPVVNVRSISTTNSMVKITGVNQNTEMSIFTGPKDTTFHAVDLNSIYGSILLDGGGGINTFQGTHTCPPHGSQVTLSPDFIIVKNNLNDQGSFTRHVVQITNIKKTKLAVDIPVNSRSVIDVMTPNYNGAVEVLVRAYGNAEVRVPKCDGEHVVYLTVDGPGEVIVKIGTGTLSDIKCTINVSGNNAPNTIIELDATAEIKPLEVHVQEGRIRFFNPESTTHAFDLIYEYIQRIQYRSGKESDVKVIRTSQNTNFVFDFGYEQVTANVAICALQNSHILIDGKVNQLSIGPHIDICNMYKKGGDSNPLVMISGGIIIAGADAHSISTVLDSKQNGPQYFNMNSTCLSQTNIQGELVYTHPPDAWMCSLLKSRYNFECATCQVTLLPYRNSLSVTTHDGNDIFNAINAKATFIYANMGRGGDIVNIEGDSCNMNVLLGVDRDGDILNVKAPDASVSGESPVVIGPVGKSGEVILVYDYTKYDIITIDHTTQHDIGRNNVVESWINNTNPYTTMNFIMNPSENVKIGQCARGSVIIIQIKNGTPQDDYTIDVLLQDINIPCDIHVLGSYKAAGVVNVIVPQATLPDGRFKVDMRLDAVADYGTFDIGVWIFKLLKTTRVKIEMNSPSDVDIKGIPGNRDMVLVLVPSSTVQLSQVVNSNLMIINATCYVPLNAYTSNYSIVVAGTSSTTVLDLHDRVVNFINGSVTIANTNSTMKPNFSTWMYDQMKSFYIPVTASGLVYVNRTQALNITTPMIYAKGVDGMYNTRNVNVFSGDININHYLPVATIHVDNVQLELDDSCTFRINQGYSVNLTTNLQHHANVYNKISMNNVLKSNWNINCEETYSNATIQWTNQAQRVEMCQNDLNIPNIVFVDVNDTKLTIDLRKNMLPTSSSYKFVATAGLFNFSNTDEYQFVITWNQSEIIPTDLNIHNTQNVTVAVVTHDTNTIGHISICMEEDTNSTLQIFHDNQRYTDNITMSYTTSTINDTLYQNGVVSIGDLFIKTCTKIDHLHFETSSAVNIHMNDTPANDVVVHNTNQLTNVTVENIKGNLFLINSTAVLSNNASLSEYRVVVSGALSTIHVDYGDLMGVFFNNSLLSNQSVTNSSLWFNTMLHQFGIDQGQEGFSKVYLDKIEAFYIVAANLKLINPDRKNASYFYVVTGQISLQDGYKPLKDMTMGPNYVIEDGRYYIKFQRDSTVLIDATYDQSAMLKVVCLKSHTNYQVNNFSSRVFGWSGQNCMGSISPVDGLMPSITFHENVEDVTFNVIIDQGLHAFQNNLTRIEYSNGGLQVGSVFGVNWNNSKMKIPSIDFDVQNNNNWTIQIVSETPLVNTSISIDGHNHGTLELYTHNDGAQYNGFINQTSFVLGNIRMPYINIAHMNIHALSQTRLDVYGAPSDMIITSNIDSQVNIYSLNQSILLNNFSATISEQVVLNGVRIIVSGKDTSATIDTGHSNVNIRGGCVRILGNYIAPISDWFSHQVLKQGIDPLEQCQICFFKTDQVAITAKIVTASNLSPLTIKKLKVIGGGCIYVSESPMTNIHVRDTTFVTPLYTLTSDVLFVNTSFAENSSLTIHKPFMSTSTLNLVFNCVDQPILSINGSMGLIRMCSGGTDTFPLINTSSVLTPTMITYQCSYTSPLSSQLINRNVVVTNSSVLIQNITLIHSGIVDLIFNITDGTNIVRIDPTAKQLTERPTFIIDTNATLVLSIPKGTSINMVGSKMYFAGQGFGITRSNNYWIDRCFLTEKECAKSHEVDVTVIGKETVLSPLEQSECYSIAIIDLRLYDRTCTCDLYEKDTQIRTTNRLDDQKQQFWVAVDIIVTISYSIFIIFSLIMLLMTDGVVIDFGFTNIIATGCMEMLQVKSQLWSVTSRLIVESCKNAALLFHTGWSEDLSSLRASQALPFYLMLAAGISVGLLWIFFSIRLYKKYEIRTFITLFAGYLRVHVFMLPYCVYHFDKSAWQSIVFVIVLVFVWVSIVVLECFRFKDLCGDDSSRRKEYISIIILQTVFLFGSIIIIISECIVSSTVYGSNLAIALGIFMLLQHLMRMVEPLILVKNQGLEMRSKIFWMYYLMWLFTLIFGCLFFGFISHGSLHGNYNDNVLKTAFILWNLTTLIMWICSLLLFKLRRQQGHLVMWICSLLLFKLRRQQSHVETKQDESSINTAGGEKEKLINDAHDVSLLTAYQTEGDITEDDRL